MRKFFAIFFVNLAFLISNVSVYSDELQKAYAKALSLINNGRYIEAYKVLDSVIVPNKDVPLQFYIKTFDTLNESFLEGQISEREFTEEVKKYDHILERREINDEKVFESFLYLLANAKDTNRIEEICRRIVVRNGQNITFSFFLTKILLQREKFDLAYKVSTRVLKNLKVDEFNYQLVSEMKYLSLISKIYSKNLNGIEEILSNFGEDESPQVKYIIMNTYYTMMKFDKAVEIINEMGLVDPETAMKVYIAVGDKGMIKKILNKYSDEIPTEVKNLGLEFVNGNLARVKNLLRSDIFRNDPMAMKLMYDILIKEKDLKKVDDTLRQISYFLFVQGRYKDAIPYLEKIRKQDDFSKYILGSCYMEQMKYRNALSIFSRVKNELKLDARIREVFCLISLVDYDVAREKLKVISEEIISRGADAQKILISQLLVDLGEVDTAFKILNSCVDKNNVDYKINLGTIYFLKSKYDDSERILESILREDPYNIYAMNALAYLWATEGKNLEKALDLVSLSLFFEPEDYTLLDTKSFVYYKMGEFKKARDFIVKAIQNMEKEGRRSYEIYLHAGEIFLSMNEKVKALEMLKKAQESYLNIYRSENEEIKSLMEKL